MLPLPPAVLSILPSVPSLAGRRQTDQFAGPFLATGKGLLSFLADGSFLRGSFQFLLSFLKVDFTDEHGMAGQDAHLRATHLDETAVHEPGLFVSVCCGESETADSQSSNQRRTPRVESGTAVEQGKLHGRHGTVEQRLFGGHKDQVEFCHRSVPI